MNLRSLQIFDAVCEEENITKAAHRLYMTQPAVSHAIRELEEELHVQLFHRYGKRISLNETGAVFHQRVQRVLLSYNELMHHILTLEEEACIRIGSSITIANDRLPHILKKFKDGYPHTPVTVTVESAANILERLRVHTIDIAIVEGMVHHEDWKQIFFSSYDLKVICAKKNILSKKQSIRWDMVSSLPWLLREKGSAVRDTFDSACHLHQILIEPVWTSVNSQALLQAVRADLGITILPDFIMQVCPFHDELHILDIEQETLRNDNHIVYDKNLFLSEPTTALINLLKTSSER